MEKINLLARNKPVLLLNPSNNSEIISQQIVALLQELTSGLKLIDAASASSQSVKRTIRLCQRGISKLLSLQNTASILSPDLLEAEQLINESVEQLATTLNEFCLELKARSANSTEELIDYLETLDGLVAMLANWSSDSVEQEAVQSIDKELQQYL